MSYFVLSIDQQPMNLRKKRIKMICLVLCLLTIDTLIGDKQISRFIGTFVNKLLSENHFTFRYSIAKFSYFMGIIHNTITFRGFTAK